ncbi:malonyl CoA-ACP transacylase [Mycobacterium sp. Y57]|uniref:DUF7158 domain-containing protein n=1 Tax=Mycolicibacterium xanthum TaxID=2796469 RepID=UPI001C84152C|nr:malonyl CoA-ACP transacylase [Mycolicibacterium xanthum]MBX7432274.1 malonyl CoA-ACP transacylase [Mycolicibacterium xanthum]
MSADVAATVGAQVVTVADVDRAERVARAGDRAGALPRPGTGEARQLRRWLTQVLTARRVVAAEAAVLAVDDADAPTQVQLLPDEVARMEIGSVAAATLSDPSARAVFAHVTSAVRVSDEEVADYHARNPSRFAVRRARAGGWHGALTGAALEDARPAIAAHLLAAARRRVYRRWLDERCAALVVLAPGYEHPGDPRQPDNIHRH